MVFTRKYKPEPKEPLRLRERRIAFTCSVKYLVVLLDPALNCKRHLTKKNSTALCECVEKPWVKNGALLHSSPKDAQDSLAATNTVCISGQVAHGEQGGSEEPTAKPSG